MRLSPLLFSLLLAGCTVPGYRERPRSWGEDATLLPSGARLRSAAAEAFSHPWTWTPALGALVLGLSDLDDNIAEWAYDENPVFGSPERAMRKSNEWKNTLLDVAFVTALAADSGPRDGNWLRRKGTGVLGFGLSNLIEKETVDALKESVGRERFDRSDDRSFPSGHSASAFHSATWTNANLDYMDLSPDLHRILKYTNLAGAAGVAWARIEAGRHYPSDVLIGAALGNASALFFQRALLGIPEPGDPELLLSVGGGMTIGLRWSF